MSQLSLLSEMTTVVADTGELDAIARVRPQDATTNPSLLLKVAKQDAYSHLLDEAITLAKASDSSADLVDLSAQYLAVLVGREILNLIPGRVSTEVDARLSFDTPAMITTAERLIAIDEAQGVSRDRVLIKIASTWEGIKAAEYLEANNIQCNLTLLFNFGQAQACAEAGVYLISPFVGRIYDWYKARSEEAITPENDPGVKSVSDIYTYYREHDYQTIVMGASFRTTGQVLALAGCDRLTISPALLDDLAATDGEVERKLIASGEIKERPEPITEAQFRWALNTDPMANEKLAEGITQFAKDQVALEDLIKARLS